MVEIIFRKERTTESGGIDFEIVNIDTSTHIVHKLILFFGSPWGTKHNTDFRISGCLLSRKI